MKFKVEFYINEEYIEGGDLYIEAEDMRFAKQSLYLKLNEKQGIPSIWNTYSDPIPV